MFGKFLSFIKRLVGRVFGKSFDGGLTGITLPKELEVYLDLHKSLVSSYSLSPHFQNLLIGKGSYQDDVVTYSLSGKGHSKTILNVNCKDNNLPLRDVVLAYINTITGGSDKVDVFFTSSKLNVEEVSLEELGVRSSLDNHTIFIYPDNDTWNMLDVVFRIIYRCPREKISGSEFLVSTDQYMGFMRLERKEVA